MNRNKWFVIFILIAVAATGIAASAYLDILLLSKLPLLLIASAITGIILGILRARFKGKSTIEKGEVSRHGIGAFIEHWMTGLGILLLIVSGFMIGFLFFPHFADTPKSVLFPLNMHFIGLIITIFGGFYFLSYYIFSRKLSVLIPNMKDILQCTIGIIPVKKEMASRKQVPFFSKIGVFSIRHSGRRSASYRVYQDNGAFFPHTAFRFSCYNIDT
jgi:hypothetical protein